MISSAVLRRPRVLMAGVGALLLVVAAFSLPAVQGVAQEFLSIFRVKSIQPVAPPPPGIQPPVRPDEVITVIEKQEGQTKTFASVVEAAAAGFTLRTPARLPAGVSATPQVTVKEPSGMRFTADRQMAEAALAAAGITGVVLDPRLDGAEFQINVPAMAVLAYSDRLTLTQGRSPEVLGPSGLDYDKLRAQALSVLAAYAPDTAAQLGAIGGWRSTLPLPLPADTPRRAVTVDGVYGLVVEDGAGTPGHAVVMWQKDGVVYGLAGAFPAAELLATANSLH